MEACPALLRNTIIDPALVQKQFQDILRHGISIDKEEHDIGTSAMGTPIFNNSGRPMAVLVAVGSSQRITSDIDSPMAVR